jgi:N-acetylglucosamine kinase-like BadF-type ATPase
MGADGVFLGRGDGPPIQVTTMGVQDSAHVVGRLIMDAGTQGGADGPLVAVVGLAGAGSPQRRRDIESSLAAEASLLGTDRVRVVSDIEAVAAAALSEGTGVALWSGTGSFAVASDGGKHLWRTGGRGYLLGDEGSAYSIVVAAARAALRARDRIGPATDLLPRFEDALDVAGVEALATVMEGKTSGEIAGLFPVVLEVDADGDELARTILDDGAEQLVRLASAACVRASLVPVDTDVVLGGGALGQQRYAERVVRSLVERGFHDIARTAPRQPCEGAALLARAWRQGEAPMCFWVEPDKDHKDHKDHKD